MNLPAAAGTVRRRTSVSIISCARDSMIALYHKIHHEPQQPPAVQEITNIIHENITKNETVNITIENNKAVVTSREPIDQDTKERLVVLLTNTPGVIQVDDQIKAKQEEPACQYYTIRSGDTLSSIAQQFYGDANRYNEIFKANSPPLKDPDEIQPNVTLRVPPDRKR